MKVADCFRFFQSEHNVSSTLGTSHYIKCSNAQWERVSSSIVTGLSSSLRHYGFHSLNVRHEKWIQNFWLENLNGREQVGKHDIDGRLGKRSSSSKFRPFKLRQIVCVETSGTDYTVALRHNFNKSPRREYFCSSKEFYFVSRQPKPGRLIFEILDHT